MCKDLPQSFPLRKQHKTQGICHTIHFDSHQIGWGSSDNGSTIKLPHPAVQLFMNLNTSVCGAPGDDWYPSSLHTAWVSMLPLNVQASLGNIPFYYVTLLWEISIRAREITAFSLKSQVCCINGLYLHCSFLRWKKRKYLGYWNLVHFEIRNIYLIRVKLSSNVETRSYPKH